MIVCANCGELNGGDSAFCGSCGAFLEWVGASEEDSAGLAVADATEAAPASPAAGAVEPAAQTVARTAGDAVGRRAVDAAAHPAGDAVAHRGGDAVAHADGSRVPGVVRPGEAVRRRSPRPPQVEPRPPAPGELICPRCGAGSDPSRRFCRSCGASLHAATTQPRPGFWRRLAARLSRRRSYAAGTRRRTRQPSGFPKGLAVLAVVAALVFLAVGPGRPTLDRLQTDLRDRLASPAPVTPTAWSASSSLPEHGPDLLSDRVTNQFWAPDGDPDESWVEAELPRPVRLLRLVINAGQSTEADVFQQEGRPHEVTVTATAAGGGAVTVPLVVRDQAGPQRFTVKGHDIVRVRLTFNSAHAMEDARYMAVGELEFFAR